MNIKTYKCDTSGAKARNLPDRLEVKADGDGAFFNIEGVYRRVLLHREQLSELRDQLNEILGESEKNALVEPLVHLPDDGEFPDKLPVRSPERFYSDGHVVREVNYHRADRLVANFESNEEAQEFVDMRRNKVRFQENGSRR